MKVISTKKAPAAIGPYSQAIQVGNLVYTSGQIPLDPATGVFVEGGIKEKNGRVAMNEAWGKINFDFSTNDVHYLKVGRQKLSYDDERILGGLVLDAAEHQPPRAVH